MNLCNRRSVEVLRLASSVRFRLCSRVLSTILTVALRFHQKRHLELKC